MVLRIAIIIYLFVPWFVPYYSNATELQAEEITRNEVASLDNEKNNETQNVRKSKTRIEDLYQTTFGRRPFGPHSRFEPQFGTNLKWVGYFCEETFVPVLQDKTDRTMADCTVVEVNKDRDQNAAMIYFGHFMELVPLSIPDMIHVITYCGMMDKNRVVPKTTLSQANGAKLNSIGKKSEPSVVLPGTLWCGMQDKADRYGFLGGKKELDSCCRTHDHCPVKLGIFEINYGAANYGIVTTSHCLCDFEFYRCLKRVGTGASQSVGHFFFNVLRMRCIGKNDYDGRNSNYNGRNSSTGEQNQNPRYQCFNFDNNEKCRYWRKNQDFSYNLTKKEPSLKF